MRTGGSSTVRGKEKIVELLKSLFPSESESLEMFRAQAVREMKRAENYLTSRSMSNGARYESGEFGEILQVIRGTMSASWDKIMALRGGVDRETVCKNLDVFGDALGGSEGLTAGASREAFCRIIPGSGGEGWERVVLVIPLAPLELEDRGLRVTLRNLAVTLTVSWGGMGVGVQYLGGRGTHPTGIPRERRRTRRIHPHASSAGPSVPARVCRGEAEVAYSEAIRRRDFLSAVSIVVSVLNNYGDGAYESLENFSDKEGARCVGCQNWEEKREVVDEWKECWMCKSLLCPKCTKRSHHTDLHADILELEWATAHNGRETCQACTRALHRSSSPHYLGLKHKLEALEKVSKGEGVLCTSCEQVHRGLGTGKTRSVRSIVRSMARCANCGERMCYIHNTLMRIRSDYRAVAVCTTCNRLGLEGMQSRKQEVEVKAGRSLPDVPPSDKTGGTLGSAPSTSTSTSNYHYNS
jgi:hypothetical protein